MAPQRQRLRRRFPLSYRCRNWPLGVSLAFTPWDTEVIIDDTTRNRHTVLLLLRNDSLIAVGVETYLGSVDDMSGRSE